MGTSKDILHDEIFELKVMLEYVEKNYPQVYEEAEAYFMNVGDLHFEGEL